MTEKRRYRLSALAAAGVLALTIWLVWYGKPPLLESYSYSTAVYDRSGKLLRLGLSGDDKYRLRVRLEDIPENTKKALLLYEDRWFYYHPGVNPLRMFKAAAEMLAGGRRQGASTITMQTARLIFGIDSSTPGGKILQMLRALQLELYYSKDEILEAYFNLAPYGGNIEGIGAAALIYFNVRAAELNLLQSIMLTVIPQNPVKRRLSMSEGVKEAEQAAARLKELWRETYPQADNDYLDLPVQPQRHLPFTAPHLVQELSQGSGGEIFTTLDVNYQKLLEDIIRGYVKEHRRRGIYNAAALIVNYKTMEVLASVGSADFFNSEIDGQVDGTNALRSPGSTLKPFIYALAMEQGLIHPLSMLKDVPRNYGLYTPENFDRSFYGWVNATEALVYSRNIPAVELLLRLKENSFYQMLQKASVRKMREPGFYGLALALGGIEMSVRDLAGLYAMLGNYGQWRPLKMRRESPEPQPLPMMSKEAAFLTLQMLAENPPVDEENIPFTKKEKSKAVYWKTGTSFGFKDAWSAGLAGDYVVVVWVGNFDGTPNPHLVGRKTAAPLFFRIIRTLDRRGLFEGEGSSAQGLNVARVEICKNSGDIANAYCPQKIKGYFIPGVSTIKVSNITRLIPIDTASGKRACRHRPPKTRLEVYDFWPSDVQQAYEQAGVTLRRPPEFAEDCRLVDTFNQGRAPQIVYPAAGSTILRRLSLPAEKIPLKASLDADASRVYWFVNNKLAGSCGREETFEAAIATGETEIKAVDDIGRETGIRVKVRLVD